MSLQFYSKKEKDLVYFQRIKRKEKQNNAWKIIKSKIICFKILKMKNHSNKNKIIIFQRKMMKKIHHQHHYQKKKKKKNKM